MINWETNSIISYNIDEAYREAIWLCVKKGYDYKIENSSKTDIGGSYIGQIRRQLDRVMIVIRNPGMRPLAPIMPPNIPSPTDDDKIAAYFDHYLVNDVVAANEDYTYGKYIKKQIPKLIERLNNSKGNTNQACLSVCDTDSIFLEDPPCLRHIEFKVVNGKLNMIVLFRSNDLVAAFPENIGGLQMFKELILSELNFPCEDGEIIYYGSGLHIYDQFFDLVNLLCCDKVELRRDIEGNIVL